MQKQCKISREKMPISQNYFAKTIGVEAVVFFDEFSLTFFFFLIPNFLREIFVLFFVKFSHFLFRETIFKNQRDILVFSLKLDYSKFLSSMFFSFYFR